MSRTPLTLIALVLVVACSLMAGGFFDGHL
jgi:hypothetical protein